MIHRKEDRKRDRYGDKGREISARIIRKPKTEN